MMVLSFMTQSINVPLVEQSMIMSQTKMTNNLKVAKKKLEKHSKRMQYIYLVFFISELGVMFFSLMMEAYLSYIVGLWLIYLILKQVNDVSKLKKKIDKAIWFQSLETTEQHLARCRR